MDPDEIVWHPRTCTCILTALRTSMHCVPASMGVGIRGELHTPAVHFECWVFALFLPAVSKLANLFFICGRKKHWEVRAQAGVRVAIVVPITSRRETKAVYPKYGPTDCENNPNSLRGVNRYGDAISPDAIATARARLAR